MAAAALAMLIALIHAAAAVGARALPDLTVTALTDPPSAIVAGTAFTVTATTTNIGQHPARPSVTGFYLSTDAALGASDLALSGEIPVRTLNKPHSSWTASVALTLSDTPAAGTYRLLACADDTKLVDESAETNNCLPSAGTVSFGSPPGPPPSGASSQALIQADLDAGLIDYGTSLIYRAWTLFWDSRLPARYDGAGSSGEDLSLFSEIKAALPHLPPDQQAELQGWVARPTDPRSPFGPAAAAFQARAAQAPDTSVKCTTPNAWYHLDSPNDNTGSGFRAWICAARQADANPILGPVLTDLTGIAQLFTKPEPAGMGPPVPDTLSPDNGGNGKIDVYLLAPNECRDRNGRCLPIPGNALAAAPPDGPIGQVVGFPARSSSGYMIVDVNATDTEVLAHEFFHILQFAHTVGGLQGEFGNLASSWYVEASAKWAEWHPNLRELSKDNLYDQFVGFQESNLSLLEHSFLDHQYESWIWPLFQELKAGGATAVYQSWASAESASDPAGIDAAVNSHLSFADSFRDFSVWNLQPGDYFPTLGDTGLENDRWRSRIDDFPTAPHIHSTQELALGPHSVVATVSVLAAQDDRFLMTDGHVRQVTIDLSPLRNAGSANLDLVGRLADTHRWRRVKADSSTYTFCRDFPDEDFSAFYVVLSNHASSRVPNGGPDPAAAITGFYKVEAKDHCDIPIAYKGTFKMKETLSGFGTTAEGFTAAGNVSFKYYSTEASCGSGIPPTADSLHYCYTLDSAQETWTHPAETFDGVEHGTCTQSFQDAHFSYANDQGRHGQIDIQIREINPVFDNIYSVWFGSNEKTMVVDTTCEDGWSGSTTIRLPFYAIDDPPCYNEDPPARFTGWPLSGSCTFVNGRDVITTTTWSWDLEPVFQQ